MKDHFTDGKTEALWQLKSSVLSHTAGRSRAWFSMQSCDPRAQVPNPYTALPPLWHPGHSYTSLDSSGIWLASSSSTHPHKPLRYFIIHTDDTSNTMASSPWDPMTPFFLHDSHILERVVPERLSHLIFPNSWSHHSLLCPFTFPTHSLLFILYFALLWDYDLGYWCPSRTGLSKGEPIGQIWPITYCCK